jgi:uncharacterized protein (TIGR02678 family)
VSAVGSRHGTEIASRRDVGVANIAGREVVAKSSRPDSHSIGLQQARHVREEFCGALRALLMTPLMTPAHCEFAAVRRHADGLREWFARETGWALHIERDCARLYKRPADLLDPTRGLPGYDRRRYVLLCLACAVLERADPQITLRILGERLLILAAEPALLSRGFTFTLQLQHERRELVAVCRSLLDFGVLLRVAGDEEGYVRNATEGAEHLHDALYDVQRRALAGMLAAVRGPSTWAEEEAPVGIDLRLQTLVAELVPDSDEGRRTAIRHDLSRRLLDDPVVYVDSLDSNILSYFTNQRGPMGARLAEAAGLVAEQRAEGLALVDEAGGLTDVSMPAEGTEAHVTLLVAEFLARRPEGSDAAPARRTETDVAEFVVSTRERYGRYWRKSAREPGAERELARSAIDRLQKLRLIAVSGEEILPLPALARFAAGTAEIVEIRPAPKLLPDSIHDDH